MSSRYSVSIIINAEYSKENILKILQQGENLGFLYYDWIPEQQHYDAPLLDATRAFERWESPPYSTYLFGGPVFCIKYEDTYFEMDVGKKKGQ
jgi:hypothetical protein